ncbi:MAG: hypothetical protein K2N55_08630, partial [Lachnospiraceae bacterium]|nr:hypothetical protein [Lachnospiraceae bacterium]
MAEIKKIVREFLLSCLQGESGAEWLDENIEIDYSTVGIHRGKKDVISALRLPQDFNVHTITITNIESMEAEDRIICNAIVHHLTGYEEKGVLYPFLFGGKYSFVVEGSSSKIMKIKFDLEYEYGNTCYVKGQWKHFDFHSGDRRIQNSTDTVYGRKKDMSTPQYAVNCFFWAMDTLDDDLVKNVITKDFTWNNVDNDTTIQMADFKKFIREDKAWNDMQQYSYRTEVVAWDRNECRMKLNHLQPYKTGNKHLCNTTRYHQFFNEDMIITCISENGQWKVKQVDIEAKVNVLYVG